MNPEIMAWYSTLAKSPLTPPGYAFGIIWPILYGLMTFAAWLVWRTGYSLKLFWAHLVLNFAWSFVFFSGHFLLASQIMLVVILAMVAIMAHRFYAQNKTAGLLLLPYIAWLCFASYLNAFILISN
jgi:tryptophan-rich sensory protein